MKPYSPSIQKYIRYHLEKGHYIVEATKTIYYFVTKDDLYNEKDVSLKEAVSDYIINAHHSELNASKIGEENMQIIEIDENSKPINILNL